ncbi:DUF423 domain-containing protein [Puniceicoccus vermicola]|uniref:DUF423 domain-containing protein n=1 Tax=Puniceicoccus vermicola TaxID=388746 RepID=A0A7X1AUF1_9BACT|nr:DUF423 domain-containing protein [Puniceicoccus vermicola]MBC2600220.1 DUF423 domain-containing protein [Puniceicoccus vermicola]
MSRSLGIDRWILGLVAILGFCGVVGGAIGAHPPEGFLAEAKEQAAWTSASLFLLFHVLAILALADLRSRSLAPFRLSVIFFLVGIFLFSGSIFALSAGAPGLLGPVTPLGGLALMIGWLSLAFRLLGKTSAY